MQTILLFFFFNDTATTEIYTYGHTLSLHDALPICCVGARWTRSSHGKAAARTCSRAVPNTSPPCSMKSATTIRVVMCWRSEEHTSELQSLMRISYAVFCLKKKNKRQQNTIEHTTRIVMKQNVAYMKKQN